MNDSPPANWSHRVIEFIEQDIPFNRLLGMRVVSLVDGHAVMEVPYRPDLVGDPYRPALHGGVVSTLIDATGGAAAFTRIEAVDRISTVDMRVDYLRPAAQERLVADAQVQRMGNRVAAVQVVVHQGDPDEPIALGRCVYNVKRNVGQPMIRARGSEGTKDRG